MDVRVIFAGVQRKRNEHTVLSFEQALEQILSSVEATLESEEVTIPESRGRALARDVFAPISLPPFDNSAVDGYAVRASDTRAASSNKPVHLRIIETIAAGSIPRETVFPGQAARILTGAPLPRGADALVMVEDTREPTPDEVCVLTPASAAYIRRAGSDLPSGALAIPKGSEIDTGAAALLAALGHRTASCTQRPRVAVLTTGDEIYSGAGDLPFGSIYDANGPALAAAIEQAGGDAKFQRHPVADDLEAVRSALRGVNDCDIVITSGGVSVGQFDFVKAAVEEMGSLDFWRIAIKPGKPLAFGRLGSALFFGLPGNPVSSLVTFALFVRPALRKRAGYSRLFNPVIPVTLGAALPHQPGRREFARARLETVSGKDGSELRAFPLGAQDSHRLSSLALAEVLLIAHEDHQDFDAGETLPAMFLN